MRAINGPDAPLEKILEDAGMTYDQYQNYRRHRSAKTIFFDDYFKKGINPPDMRNPMDYLAKVTNTPFDDCVANEKRRIVLEAIDALPQGRQGSVERTKKVIYLYWFEGLTLEEIGESYGITRERTRQILDKGLEKLEKILSARLRRQIIEGNSRDGRIVKKFGNINSRKKAYKQGI